MPTEVTNKSKWPVQLVVRSKAAPKAFTTLNVPSVGGNKNVVVLEDEQMTDQIYRLESSKMISTRKVN